VVEDRRKGVKRGEGGLGWRREGSGGLEGRERKEREGVGIVERERRIGE